MSKVQLIRAVPKAEAAYVERGRTLFTVAFPSEADFEAPSWDVRHLRLSHHSAANARAYFTRYGSTTEALPARFSHVIKAYVLCQPTTVSTLLNRVNATRMLWSAIEQRLAQPGLFEWASVTEADLLGAEQEMLRHWGNARTYKRCAGLQGMMRALAATPHGPIVRPMQVPFVTPRQEDFDRYTLAGQEQRRAKMPPDDAIHAIGELFAGRASDPCDRLILCILAILLATALRIGEVLTLPVSCVVTEGQGRQRRFGIRYHKEKSAGGEKQLAVQWMTSRQAELARRAIQEARRLTASARARAKVLEGSPGTVALSTIAEDTILSREEIASLLGGQPAGLKHVWKALPRIRTDHAIRYRASDVRAYLHSRCGPLWVIDRRDGTRQMLSETLFVTLRNFMHRRRGTNALLVDPVRVDRVNTFLHGDRKRAVRSVFDRFDLRTENGECFRLHTHQFRHWVTTKAAEAGVPDHIIARWQGREHLGDLAAYIHMAQAARLETLKAALKNGRVKGQIAEMYFSLKEDVRDVFLEGQLQAVHVTPLGLCVHDFKVTPCPKYLNCVKGCEDYVLDVRHPAHIRKLVQLRERTQLTLDQAVQQNSKCEGDLSENWIVDAQATLAGVTRVLDAAASASPDAVLQPFVGRGTRFTTKERLRG